MSIKLIEYIIKINKSRVLYKSEPTIIDRLLAKTFLKIIPKKITPNQITIFRLITIPILIILLLLENYIVGIILFIISAFSDVIDGALARTRNQITSWGAIYDPIADKLLIGSVSIILVSKFISLYIGLLIVIIEIIIILLILYSLKGEIPPAKIFGKIKGVVYSIGLSLLILHALYNNEGILSLAKTFVYLGLVLAILSPILYLKMLKRNI